MASEQSAVVVGLFHDVAAFKRALDGLLKMGFDPSAVSVLGSHRAIVDHFGKVPPIGDIADAADTPREALDTEVTLRRAIDWIAGTLALISEVGAAAAAYAVGGPIGIAATSADLTDNTVEDLLSGYVDSTYRDRFEENVRHHGGLVCWVHVQDEEAVDTASDVLTAAGGSDVHVIED